MTKESTSTKFEEIFSGEVWRPAPGGMATALSGHVHELTGKFSCPRKTVGMAFACVCSADTIVGFENGEGVKAAQLTETSATFFR